MKKKHYLIGIITVVLAACGSSEGGGIFSSGSIDMSEAKATKAIPIVNENNAPQCQMNLQVKYMKGDNEVAKNINNAITEQLFQMTNLTVQQAVDSFANNYTHEYQKNMAPLYREDRGDQAKHAWYEYHFKVNTETRQEQKGILAYIINFGCKDTKKSQK